MALWYAARLRLQGYSEYSLTLAGSPSTTREFPSTRNTGRSLSLMLGPQARARLQRAESVRRGTHAYSRVLPAGMCGFRAAAADRIDPLVRTAALLHVLVSTREYSRRALHAASARPASAPVPREYHVSTPRVPVGPRRALHAMLPRHGSVRGTAHVLAAAAPHLGREVVPVSTHAKQSP